MAVIEKLDANKIGQETPMWCWAASGEMIMSFHNKQVSQCNQANNRFGEADCCQSPVPSKCVKGGWPEFSKYGFASDRTSNTALSWNQIVEQIKVRKSPIAFTWRWVGGGGHMMVIFGYEIDSSNRNWVWIIDPLPVNVGTAKRIKYSAYVSGSNYEHWDDFYNIKFGPGGSGMMNNGPGSSNDLVPGQSIAIEAANHVFSAEISELVTNGPGNAESSSTVTFSFVRLDTLQELPKAPGFGPEFGITELLSGTSPHKVAYPISTGKEIVVERGDSNSWELASIGESTTLKSIQDAIGPAGDNQDIHAIIEIPALNQQLLVERQKGGDLYTPLIDDPVNGLFKGKRLTSQEALNRLIAAATKHDGQPR